MTPLSVNREQIPSGDVFYLLGPSFRPDILFTPALFSTFSFSFGSLSAVHHPPQSTLITTFQPSAPASRIAHARHPRLRRLMTAFQPRSAQRARTRTSMSDPNCRRRVSLCILALISSVPGSACVCPFSGASSEELSVFFSVDTGWSEEGGASSGNDAEAGRTLEP